MNEKIRSRIDNGWVTTEKDLDTTGFIKLKNLGNFTDAYGLSCMNNGKPTMLVAIYDRMEGRVSEIFDYPLDSIDSDGEISV